MIAARMRRLQSKEHVAASSKRDRRGENTMRAFSTLVILALMATSAAAETLTIATFADPAEDASTPLFTFDGVSNIIEGGWDVPGLTLETVSGTFENVTFRMDPLLVDGFGEVQAGDIVFRDSDNNEIFTVGFDSAQINVLGLGATEFLATNEVTFSGSILPLPVQMESFSFGFSNQTQLPGAPGFTATASFTASGELVPEPATLALTLLGGCCVLRRKRR